MRPAFGRRSPLIDYVLGVGERQGMGTHPQSNPLTPQEQELFNLWVTLARSTARAIEGGSRECDEVTNGMHGARRHGDDRAGRRG